MSTAGDGYVHDEAFDAAVEAACSSTVVSMLCAASTDKLHHVLKDDERNSPRIRFEEKHGRAKYLYEWEKSQIYVDAFDPKARKDGTLHFDEFRATYRVPASIFDEIGAETLKQPQFQLIDWRERAVTRAFSKVGIGRESGTPLALWTPLLASTTHRGPHPRRWPLGGVIPRFADQCQNRPT